MGVRMSLSIRPQRSYKELNLPVTTPSPTRAAPVSSPITGPGTILSAGYGAGGKVKDVTDIVRKQYAAGKHEFIPDNALFGDPAPGWIKMLVIVFCSAEGCQCTTYAFEDTRPDKTIPDPLGSPNRMIRLP